MKTAQKAVSKVAAKQIIAMKRPTSLKWVEMYQIEGNKFIWAKALYLYWACFRGHVPLIKFILQKDKISPFARVYEGRSPLMASLIGKHKPNTVSYKQAKLQLKFKFDPALPIQVIAPELSFSPHSCRLTIDLSLIAHRY